MFSKLIRISEILLILLAVMAFVNQPVICQTEEKTETESVKKDIPANEKLVIIWTSGDKEVATKMVFMYTLNSRKFGWWEDITLVVWGPSQKLLTEDAELQEKIAEMKKAGVTLRACKGCSDQYGISDKLEELGITVKYMGNITDFIKEGRHILTF
jgi:hypothetical protein